MLFRKLVQPIDAFLLTHVPEFDCQGEKFGLHLSSHAACITAHVKVGSALQEAPDLGGILTNAILDIYFLGLVT